MSIRVQVLHVLKTHEGAEQHLRRYACRDTVLIGKMPTPLLSASLNAVLYDTACLKRHAVCQPEGRTQRGGENPSAIPVYPLLPVYRLCTKTAVCTKTGDSAQKV